MVSYDFLGPEKILKAYDPKTGMKAVIVLDNTARGPAKGGIRMTPTVDEEEVFGLARAMTLKNALANLPFGGGKSGIIANPKELTIEEKEGIVRAYGKAIKQLAPEIYVAAPDISMGEREMRWIADEAGPKSITGKPVDLGGIPHELGSTGYGVYISVRELLKLQDDSLEGKTVTVQGYGNVGSFAADFMERDGAKLIAASDSSCTLYDPDGIDAHKLREFKESGKRLSEYPEHEKLEPMDVLFIECDILVPAAQKHVITADNQDRVSAKIISQGANLPIEHHVERLLEKRGVQNIPDILANAGGVISSYIEHIGGSADDIFPEIEKIIAGNIKELGDALINTESDARKACIELAHKRLEQ